MQFKRGDVVYNHYSKYRHCERQLWDGVGIVSHVYTHTDGEVVVIVHGTQNMYGSSGGFNPEVLELLGHIELPPE